MSHCCWKKFVCSWVFMSVWKCFHWAVKKKIKETLVILRSKSEQASDSGDSDNNNNTGEEGGEEVEDEDDEYDEEYVPEWHEDLDEDDIDDDDFFSDDDASENLERDFSPFDWTGWTKPARAERTNQQSQLTPPLPVFTFCVFIKSKYGSRRRSWEGKRVPSLRFQFREDKKTKFSL